MMLNLLAAAAAGVLLIAISTGGAAFAQKQGGILKMYVWDNPPSMSMLDGVNPIGQRTTMGVFNNLVMFDQHVKQSSLESIVPDLATGWSWNEEGTALTLPLRQGVKWHDGKPFTAKDVRCTWDLLLDASGLAPLPAMCCSATCASIQSAPVRSNSSSSSRTSRSK